MQYDTGGGGMPAAPGTQHNNAGGRIPAAPGMRYYTPASGMDADRDPEPSAEYAAVPYQVQSLYSAPDDQPGWAARW
jgi:hypothetical protein